MMVLRVVCVAIPAASEMGLKLGYGERSGGFGRLRRDLADFEKPALTWDFSMEHSPA
jgi:hypothetical protein